MHLRCSTLLIFAEGRARFNTSVNVTRGKCVVDCSLAPGAQRKLDLCLHYDNYTQGFEYKPIYNCVRPLEVRTAHLCVFTYTTCMVLGLCKRLVTLHFY